MPWRHGSRTGDRVCSIKVSQDTWMLKTCKIKHMYENMQKQRENNHRSQQAGQHVALAERRRRGSERKQGRDDKRRQAIAYGEQGETGPRNGGHLRKAPVAAAAGPATQRSAAAV